MVSISDRFNFNFRIDELVDPPANTVLPHTQTFSCSILTAPAGTTDYTLPAPAFCGQFAVFSVVTNLAGTRRVRFSAAFDDLGHNAIEFSGGFGCAVFFSLPLRWVLVKHDLSILVTV